MAFEVTNRNKVFSGKVFSVEQLTLALPGGKTHVYELLTHPGAVTIVPVDDDGNILFVSQYRVGVGKDLLELPAGTLSAGEKPLACAEREVREETGMAARTMQKIGEFYLAPGYSSEYQYIYLATGLYPAPLQGDEDEFLNLVKIPVDQVYQMAEAGELYDAKTLAALLLARSCIYDMKHQNQ
jgi:ADP-ribose pyrophosphatase